MGLQMYFNKLPEGEFESFYKGELKKIKFSDYKGKNIILVFYPLDFTYVCPTEINTISDLKEEFDKIGATVFFISCDSFYPHQKYSEIPRDKNGIEGVAYPMISDYNKEITNHFNLLHEDGFPMRSTIITDKTGKIGHLSINDVDIGRKTSEILRLTKAINRVRSTNSKCMCDWEE